MWLRAIKASIRAITAEYALQNWSPWDKVAQGSMREL